jgi:hypothetical protein
LFQQKTQAMTIVERRIAKEIEGLVGNRFNTETLEAKLTEIFGQEIKVEDISRDDDELVDFNLLTTFDDQPRDLYGYIDIYFLPMRRQGFDGATFYVTEVAIDFE